MPMTDFPAGPPDSAISHCLSFLSANQSIIRAGWCKCVFFQKTKNMQQGGVTGPRQQLMLCVQLQASMIRIEALSTIHHKAPKAFNWSWRDPGNVGPKEGPGQLLCCVQLRWVFPTTGALQYIWRQVIEYFDCCHKKSPRRGALLCNLGSQWEAKKQPKILNTCQTFSPWSLSNINHF